jgi:tRNA1(Val) A37 N6-methylase TrmN6
MERCDHVNDALKLIQNTEGLTFGTDALLLAGYINTRQKRGCELGGGSGIISMLLLTRDKLARAVALEVQEEYASLTAKNAEINGLNERLSSICTDLRDYICESEFDLIYSNPPYMKSDSGKANDNDKKNIARHEIHGGIYDFCAAAKRLLKFGGTFAVVYRPDRLIDLINSMRACDVEPKRMTFVHADTKKESSMVLIEAKRGGRGGMMLTPPLIIYSDGEHKEYSEDMKYIMENGSFSPKYKR